MALFRGIQEYIVLDANNITLVFDSSNIVSISGNILLYPPQGHPILYKYSKPFCNNIHQIILMIHRNCIGQAFAMTEIKVALVVFLRKFRFRLEPSKPLEMTFPLLRGTKDGMWFNIEKIE